MESSSAQGSAALQGLEKTVLVLDGGLGTSLEDLYAVKFDDSTPLWSSHLLLSDPSTLRNAQIDFSKAGADILLTATYQASQDGFAATSRNHPSLQSAYSDAATCMRSSVDIARQAHILSGRRDGIVALSLGAYGATLSPSSEYSGCYDKEHDSQKALYDFHLDRIKVFAEYTESWDKIDVVAFETLPRLDEVTAVREVMKTLSARDQAGEQPARLRAKPYWISCVFPNEDMKLPDDSSIAELSRAMLSGDLPLPIAIGVNCTKLHLLQSIVTSLSNAVRDFSLPRTNLVIYPDGATDLVYNTKFKRWEPANMSKSSSAQAASPRCWDEELFGIVQEVQHQHNGIWKGVIVGGCCKTTPSMIQKLRRRIDGENPT